MKIGFILLIISVCTSCSTYRYIYTASPANNPLFTQKGQSKIAGYYSSAESDGNGKSYARGLDLQGAYAVGNHWALAGSYYHRDEKDNYNTSYNIYDSSIVDYKRNLIEFGGGFFIHINRAKTITANIYGGFGAGKFSFYDKGFKNDIINYNRNYRSNLSRWFIQPSVNFFPGRYIRLAFALKLSFVNYSNIKTDYSREELEDFHLQDLEQRILNFTEPSISFQFGLPKFPWLKIEAIIGGISNNDNNFETDRDVRTSSGSIGFNIDLSKINKGN